MSSFSDSTDHQRIKRKLNEGDDVSSFPPLNTPNHSLRVSNTRTQFFVRMLSGGKTLVFQANSFDTVQSIHQRIQEISRIPVNEQRLSYRGKHLQSDKTLAECRIQKDSVLQLVGRMLSTDQPRAWQVVDSIISAICRMGKEVFNNNERIKRVDDVKNQLGEFLNMTPRTFTDEAASHFQVFISSRLPAAIMMLYLSSFEGNKKCGQDMIGQFISAVNAYPKNIRPQCAPILLDFCKLLRRKSTDDAMYKLCRCSLGSVLDDVGIGRSIARKASANNKAVVVFQDIFMFVSELAANLTRDLTVTVESDTVGEQPLLNDVCDFTAFLIPLITVIRDQVTLGGRISIPLSEVGLNISCYGEEIKLFYSIFIGLLEKMYLCLGKVEEWLPQKEKGEDEILSLGWCHYLAVLKELNSISKLYQGAEEEFWAKLRHRKDSISFLIIEYAKRSDDHQWILEHKEVTNSECRRHLAMMLLTEVKDEYVERHKMLIGRSQLLVVGSQPSLETTAEEKILDNPVSGGLVGSVVAQNSNAGRSGTE